MSFDVIEIWTKTGAFRAPGGMHRNAAIWWFRHADGVCARDLAECFHVNVSRVYQILAAADLAHAKQWQRGALDTDWGARLLAAGAFVGVPEPLA